ncbi:MAG: type II and III secretion system protein family protein [Gemmataceae bacterium]
MAYTHLARFRKRLRFSGLTALLSACLATCILAPGVSAQPEIAPPPHRVEEPLPTLPSKNPRPLSEVSSFVEDLSTSDAMFEVTVGQGRILTLKEKIKSPALIAVGDPTVIDFNVLPPRQIRLVGQRIGVTDLSVISSDERVFNFQVNVVADLDLLRARLRAHYPDARLRLSHIRGHLIVEGQARDTVQVARILETIRAYQTSIFATEQRKIRQQITSRPGRAGEGGPRPPREGEPAVLPVEQAPPAEIIATLEPPQLINLITVPGPQQVLLKVRVAELNRTALRQIGTDIFGIDKKNGTIVGTQIGGASIVNTGPTAVGRVASDATVSSGLTTAFGVFNRADFEIFFAALRRNTILKILAEPNLMAMNGQKATFNAGGKFPVPVAQTSSGGAAPTVTVQFEPFGVSLDFVPQILDGDRIRLAVHPVVSSVDFTLGTVLVPGGTPVPGLNSREASTTVELKHGQTLAIAGLLQLTLDGSTSRIPGLGDLPILGPFFSNTTGNRVEKELVVLITPYLVAPMNADQVPPGPGDEVKEPNDLERYLLGRIEGRTGRDFRSTVQYDDATHTLRHFLKLENDHVCGPHGFSE